VDGWGLSSRADWVVGGWVREDKGCVWVVLININDMCDNDFGKGGVRVYEAYEVK
jgi:hypothetical protein